jgi:hypothetical protein
VKPPIAIEIPIRLEITSTRLPSSLNINIIDVEVLTTSLSTQDVVIPSFLSRSTSNIPNRDILDQHSIRWVARWASVEVILLDVDTVDRNILHADVLEKNVGDEAGGVGVALDARAVFGVQHNRVLEGDVGHVVERLTTDGTDGQAVAAVAVHVVDHDVVAASHRYAIVLVDDDAVADYGVVRSPNTEA